MICGMLPKMRHHASLSFLPYIHKKPIDLTTGSTDGPPGQDAWLHADVLGQENPRVDNKSATGHPICDQTE